MNKKVVDLSSRDIRQAVSFFCFLLMSFILPPLSQCLTSLVFSQVPRGLPYFSVDFGLQGGFAHVIENEQKFPHYFGKVSLAVVLL